MPVTRREFVIGAAVGTVNLVVPPVVGSTRPTFTGKPLPASVSLASPEWAAGPLTANRSSIIKYRAETAVSDPSILTPRRESIATVKPLTVVVTVLFPDDVKLVDAKQERLKPLRNVGNSITPWLALYDASKEQRAFRFYGTNDYGLLAQINGYRNENAVPSDLESSFLEDHYFLLFLGPRYKVIRGKGTKLGYAPMSIDELVSKAYYLKHSNDGFRETPLSNLPISIPADILNDPNPAVQRNLQKLLNKFKKGVPPHIVYAYLPERDFRR